MQAISLKEDVAAETASAVPVQQFTEQKMHLFNRLLHKILQKLLKGSVFNFFNSVFKMLTVRSNVFTAYFEPRRMTAEEKDTLLATYHPDYKEEEFRTLQIGVNKGEKVPTELAALLQAHSRVKDKKIDLSKVDYDVDVLIIGGGGAGASAAAAVKSTIGISLFNTSSRRVRIISAPE